MHVEGGCYCGHITYEAEVDPDTVGICHCTDCQHLTGTAYRVSVRSYKGAFKLLSGQPRIFIKTAESGTKRAHGFCPDCGTPLYATTAGNPEVYGIRVGTTRQRTQLRPKRQIWCRSALDWATNLESLPQHPKQIA